VNYVFDNDGTFRLEVLTGGADRFIGALQALIARQVSPTRFYGRYRYTISNPSASTVDGSPVDNTIGLPDLQGVPINADSISSYTPPAGGECHIMFLDGVPSQPRCVWTSSPPTHADLLNGTTPAAKLGDTVQSMVVATPPNLTGILTFAPQPPGPPTAMFTGTPYVIVPLTSTLAILSPVSGTIVTGSAGVGMPL
jgi:hypothetical protein